MKNIFNILLIVCLLILISCKNENLTNPPVNIAEYFPSKTGTKHNYNVIINSNLSSIGKRNSYILNRSIKNNTEYIIQIDTLSINAEIAIDTSYFRKTNTGVFYYIDTTGFASAIPDTLRNYLKVDNESRLLFFPLSIGQSWPVYQIDLSISGVPIFSPLKTSAKVVEKKLLNLSIGNTQKSIETFKIEYSLIIQTTPEDEIQRYSAYGYIAENIGFIKWEGESIVLNLIRGSLLYFGLNQGEVEETLYNYLIP